MGLVDGAVPETEQERRAMKTKAEQDAMKRIAEAHPIPENATFEEMNEILSRRWAEQRAALSAPVYSDRQRAYDLNIPYRRT